MAILWKKNFWRRGRSWFRNGFGCKIILTVLWRKAGHCYKVLGNLVTSKTITTRKRIRISSVHLHSQWPLGRFNSMHDHLPVIPVPTVSYTMFVAQASPWVNIVNPAGLWTTSGSFTWYRSLHYSVRRRVRVSGMCPSHCNCICMPFSK